MPELPEVEVVRRGLERHVAGRTIAAVEVLHPRAVRRHLAGADDFAAVVCGLTVSGARRRGKYLWLPVAATPAGDAAAPATRGPADGDAALAAARGLADGDAALAAARSPADGDAAAAARSGGLAAGDAVLAHLGMSGQLLLGDPGRPFSPHVRVRFTFTDAGPDLRFTDQRTFGHLAFSPGGAVLPPLISHIAPDPMEPAFDEAAVIARLRSRSVPVKTAILDQSLVSGIGNIYADEALWRAKLHWARPANSLSRADAARVFAAVREVLAEALAAGGTSFDSLYVNVNGESGYFSRSLAVYGRAGQPCPRCATAVRRDAFMNRSAYFCPSCQLPPRMDRIRRGRGDLRDRST